MRSHAALRSLVRVAAAAFGASLLSCAGVPVDRALPEPPRPAWSKVFGNFDLQGASAIAVDASGEAYVVGGFEWSFVDAAGTEFVDPRALETPTVRRWGVFLLKLDASGGQRWARHFEGLDGFAEGIAVAVSAGKVVIAGRMMATSLDFGDAPLRNAAPPHNDVFVAAFDAGTGRLLWSRTLGGAGNDFPPSGGVAIDLVGHVHVVYSSEFPPPKIPGTGAEETILVELGPDGELLRSARSRRRRRRSVLLCSSSAAPLVSSRPGWWFTKGNGVLRAQPGYVLQVDFR